MNYDQIKKNFERGLWNTQMVKIAADKGILTPEEYREITGQEYIS